MLHLPQFARENTSTIKPATQAAIECNSLKVVNPYNRGLATFLGFKPKFFKQHFE